MTLNTNLKKIILVIFSTLILSACSTAKKSGDIEGDVYTGSETVEYLAAGIAVVLVFYLRSQTSMSFISTENSKIYMF